MSTDKPTTAQSDDLGETEKQGDMSSAENTGAPLSPDESPQTWNPTVQQPKTGISKWLGFLVAGEWIGILIAALLAALLIKTFVFQTFYIPSGSMIHTLEINDRVLVNKLAYKFGDIDHGDVVVFKRPPAETDPNIKELIKRVVAVPGDQIESKNGVVYLNGKALDEPYLSPGMRTDNLPLQTVRPGQLWLMGDNRTNSQDSRYFGQVDEKLVVGRADLRIWPFDRFGKL